MLPTRTLLRAQRTTLTRPRAIPRPAFAKRTQHARFNSTNTSETAKGAGSGALTGGLVGGGAAMAVMYGWYHFSGAKGAVQTATQAKSYVDSAVDGLKTQFKQQTPSTNEAIKTLQETANKYAAFIPGGRAYVDSAFKDLEAVREKHGGEVDEIVSQAYGELRDVSKKGFTLEAAGETVDVLSKHMQKLFSLAGDAAESIMDNHPELKEKLGGSADQLKQLGERLGPEAKKQVDETWKEVADLVKSGASMETISKAQKLIQEKMEKIKKMGEEASNQALEQVKPMLEKNPKVKKLVDENWQKLKDGNAGEIVKKVQSAISSGDTKELEEYFNQAKSAVKKQGGDQLSSWLEMIPGGSGEIGSKLQKLRELADSKGGDAEKLVKETIDEIKKVLEAKTKKAEDLYEEGKKEAKK